MPRRSRAWSRHAVGTWLLVDSSHQRAQSRCEAKGHGFEVNGHDYEVKGCGGEVKGHDCKAKGHGGEVNGQNCEVKGHDDYEVGSSWHGECGRSCNEGVWWYVGAMGDDMQRRREGMSEGR